MPHMNLYEETFIGRRSTNQDSMLTLWLDEDCCLLAVADGMGGTAGGAIASKLALEALKLDVLSAFEQSNRRMPMKDTLKMAYQHAQLAIVSYVNEHPDMQGMGTTLVCALIFGERYVIGNLGDSRIYLAKNNKVYQLSRDHTYIQDYREKYGDQVDPVIVQQYSHLLLKSIDGGSDAPDIFPNDAAHYKLMKGEGFLLCSDGLINDKVTTDEQAFAAALFSESDLESAAKRLISRAYHQGSSDNITIVLAEYGAFERLPNGKARKGNRSTKQIAKGKTMQKSVKVVLILVGVMLIAASGWGVYKYGLFDRLMNSIEQTDKAAQPATSEAVKDPVVTPSVKEEIAVHVLTGVRFETINNCIGLKPDESISWVPPVLSGGYEPESYRVFFYEMDKSILAIDAVTVQEPFIELKGLNLPAKKYYMQVETIIVQGKSNKSELVLVDITPN